MVFALKSFLVGLAVVGFVAAAQPAAAHPHVWVTAKSELVYAPDGSLTAIRHKWAFDDMFSSFATQGLDTNNDGKLSREELASLAEVNVTSLKDFEFFTKATINGKKAEFADPIDYWLDHQDNVLTLNFTLPFKKAEKTQRVELDLYDPTYFVAFGLAETDPIALVSAPSGCQINVTRAGDPAASGAGQRLSESFFNSMTAASEYGAMYANKVAVKCP